MNHLPSRFSMVKTILVLLLAAVVVGGGIWLSDRGSNRVPDQPALVDEEETPAAVVVPEPPDDQGRAQGPRFAARPHEIKWVDRELGKDTPFDPQELLPPKRFRRTSTKVRDKRLNELIDKADLDAAQAQKLLDFMNSTNAQLDESYNQVVLPRIPSNDHVERERARVEFMRSLIALTQSYDQLLAELGPQAQNAAKSMGMDMTNLLTPEQSYQLRSFLKRFGRKYKMGEPGTSSPGYRSKPGQPEG